ncbi:DUF4240 domain-containing protein [Streptomyces sp. NBC_00102]|uniref:DUF4240 domain-containing protein n=1 Tax=Streptomyces sp. NBC_00102 TaxID=2975652 RepID=UPI002252E7DD|nr:DUF4240 domain-containing protein [Streptomyces sp. NBC_00102]MCX5397852.1 DUF4240 domain-containing protein [Streptomyces sp. NBC_00102]
MDTDQFWRLIEAARRQASHPDDGGEVARLATALLAVRPVEEIVAAQQVLWDLLAASYTNPLWAAAYLINGGCSDDGFDYFRGWLIAQGRETFDRVVADPDALADVPLVRSSVADGEELDGEETLSIVWNAHIAATGEQLPDGAFIIRYPALDAAWDFDFDDDSEMAGRLPRLAALGLAECA